MNRGRSTPTDQARGTASPLATLTAAGLSLVLVLAGLVVTAPLAPAQTTSPDIELDPLWPQENLTGLRTNQPVAWVNLTLTVEVSGSDAGDIEELRIYPRGDDGPFRVAKQADDGSYWSYYNYRNYDVGDYEIVYEAETTGGDIVQASHTINTRRNIPPEAEISSPSDGLIVEQDGDGTAEIHLRGHADDPDPVRQPVDSDYTWTLSTGETFVGPHHIVEVPVGFTDITLTVRDAYGESGSKTVRVGVDDAIQIRTAMISGNDQDGVTVIDPTQEVAQELEGLAFVETDDGQDVVGADVTATLVYYGVAANEDGYEVSSFQREANNAGFVHFKLDQALFGAFGQQNVISPPGYYEIHITASADSRAGGALQDIETAEATIPVWIGYGQPLTR